MEKTKYTKTEILTAIKDTFATGECGIDPAVITEFCDKEIAALARKAEKAKETAAKKKVEGDELSDAVLAVLTEEPATIADITAKVGDEAATVSKIQYRLSQLAKNGKAIKSEVTIPGGEGVKTRKIVAYALA